MKTFFCNAGYFSWVFACLLLMIPGCQKSIDQENVSTMSDNDIASNARPSNSKALKDYKQVNLVSDIAAYHPVLIDPNLINGWGIAFAPSGPAWISAEGTSLSVIYNKDGDIVRSPVSIPAHRSASGGLPTGIVFNGTQDFKLSNGNPARFIFVGLDGIVSGWNTGNGAEKTIDQSTTSVFTGVALASDAGTNFIYIANFRTRRIEVFDKDWIRVITKPFIDIHLPLGYSPFNIQNIDGNLYVMYAKVGVNGEEEVGPGKGFVNVFNPNGTLKKRLVSRGQLNAPWGIAKAPEGFWEDEDDDDDGEEHDDDDDDDDDGNEEHDDDDDNERSGKKDLDNVILIGNFGDGRINAFSKHGQFLGQLRGHGKPIKIEGLWGISFAPPTATTVNLNWLFFAAGPGDEAHGLFGYIKKK